MAKARVPDAKKDPPIHEEILDMAKTIPDEELAKLPADLAKTVGNPKPTDETLEDPGPVTVFSAEDAKELRLTEADISDLEREGLEDAKSIRGMKTPGVLAGLCGWDKARAELVMNRANSLRLRELK